LPSVSNNRRPPPVQQGAAAGMYRTQAQNDDPPPVQDFQNYQQYLHKRATQGPADPPPSTSTTKKKLHCDGVDELGCFQASALRCTYFVLIYNELQEEQTAAKNVTGIYI